MISSYLTDSAFTAVKRGPKVLNIVGMWKEYQLSIEGIQKRPYPVGNILTRIWPWSIHIELDEKDFSHLKTAKRPNLKVRLRTYVPAPRPCPISGPHQRGGFFCQKRVRCQTLGRSLPVKNFVEYFPRSIKIGESLTGGKQDTHQELLIEAG